MQLQGAIHGVEAAVENQLRLVGGDPSVEAAARVLLAVVEPAVRQAGLDLAQQAAAEIGAQLPGQRVEVLVVEGEPVLRVSSESVEARGGPSEEYEARITLRLPESLKRLVEQAADTSGESTNSWVVKALTSKARTRRGGRHFSGTIEL